MLLNELKPALGSKQSKKRVGRGMAKHGKTCGRGHKGERARSGAKDRSDAGFEGGQMPLHRRLPKSGFRYVHRLRHHTSLRIDICYNLINKVGVESQTVTMDMLKGLGLLSKHHKSCKLIGKLDDVKAKLVVEKGAPIKWSKSLDKQLSYGEVNAA